MYSTDYIHLLQIGNINGTKTTSHWKINLQAVLNWTYLNLYLYVDNQTRLKRLYKIYGSDADQDNIDVVQWLFQMILY